MLAHIPNILPFYLQHQPSAIESEVYSLGWLTEHIVEFLIEVLKHWMANGCKKIHHNLLCGHYMLFALLYLLLHPLFHVILTKQSR